MDFLHRGQLYEVKIADNLSWAFSVYVTRADGRQAHLIVPATSENAIVANILNKPAFNVFHNLPLQVSILGAAHCVVSYARVEDRSSPITSVFRSLAEAGTSAVEAFSQFERLQYVLDSRSDEQVCREDDW